MNKTFFVCRTCLVTISDKKLMHDIEHEIKVTKRIKIKELLRSCIPEIDLKISEKPVVCEECLNKLIICYKFKNWYINVENAINSYIISHCENGLINLKNVIQYREIEKSNLDRSKLKRRHIRTRQSSSKRDVFDMLQTNTELLNWTTVNVIDEKLRFMGSLNLVDRCKNGEYKTIGNEENKKDNSVCPKKNADVNGNFNFNKTLYVALENCITEPHKSIDLPVLSNPKGIGENSIEDVAENRILEEEGLHLDNNSTIFTNQCKKLAINLRKENFPLCLYCQVSFPNENLLKQHSRKYHKSCRLCAYSTPTPYKLEAHLLLSHGNEINVQLQRVIEDNLTVKCYLCPQTTELSTLNLREHRLKNHITFIRDCYTCPYRDCNYTEKIAYLVLKHIEKEHDKNMFQCPLCYYETNSNAKIKKHVTTHMEKSNRCDICLQVLRNMSGLKSHLRTKHPDYLHNTCMDNSIVDLSSEVFEETHRAIRNLTIPNCFLITNDETSSRVVDQRAEYLKSVNPKRKRSLQYDNDCIIISDSRSEIPIIDLSDDS